MAKSKVSRRSVADNSKFEELRARQKSFRRVGVFSGCLALLSVLGIGFTAPLIIAIICLPIGLICMFVDFGLGVSIENKLVQHNESTKSD